jgi:predicted ATPase
MSVAKRHAVSVSQRKRIVLTGGPGAGKTAVLELARKHFRNRIDILHEAASIVFTGGFPRHTQPYARACGQRAIYGVQVELERMAMETPSDKAILCDRGTIDGLAYWPLERDRFFEDIGSSLDEELARYAAVIHLRTPPRGGGYHKNGVRTEQADEAEVIDERLLDVWKTHPKRFVIESAASFMDKAHRAMVLIDELAP